MPEPASAPRSRPYIHINLALDEHGSTAGGDGVSLALSCAADWRRVHLLRERYDAVAVGCRTWMLDRPQLTARAEWLGRPARRQPTRIVFCGGSHGALPTDGRPTLRVGARSDHDDPALHVAAPGRTLAEPLRTLAAMGIATMLIEGGLTLLGSFFRDGFVDRCSLFVRTADPAAGRAALHRCPSLPPHLVQELRPTRYGLGTLFEAELRMIRIEP